MPQLSPLGRGENCTLRSSHHLDTWWARASAGSPMRVLGSHRPHSQALKKTDFTQKLPVVGTPYFRTVAKAVMATQGGGDEKG